jgi:hypothetical protein
MPARTGQRDSSCAARACHSGNSVVRRSMMTVRVLRALLAACDVSGSTGLPVALRRVAGAPIP